MGIFRVSSSEPSMHSRQGSFSALRPQRVLTASSSSGAGAAEEDDELKKGWKFGRNEGPMPWQWKLMCAILYMLPWVDVTEKTVYFIERFPAFHWTEYFTGEGWCGGGITCKYLESVDLECPRAAEAKGAGLPGDGWLVAAFLRHDAEPFEHWFYIHEWAPLIIFFGTYLGIVRNKKIPHVARYHIMLVS
jgi:hypothetical protein